MPPDKSQKTEAPTQRRLKEARDKGQVAKSPDLSAWAGMLGAVDAAPDDDRAGRPRHAQRAPGHGHGDRAPEPGRRHAVHGRRRAEGRWAS